MTEQKLDNESRALWQEALGAHNKAIWEALEAEPAPAVMRVLPPQPVNRWQWATAASLVLCSALSLVVWKQARTLREQNLDYALLQLQSPRTATQLDALLTLRTLGHDIPQHRWTVLRKTLAETQDPNVQLATLELLIDIGAITRLSDLPQLPATMAPQQRLLEVSFQSWQQTPATSAAPQEQ
ncbi:MAG: hypothetical protein KDI28_11260 [Pseudomonadales bacterium]|nr:hypothetical protein [Pseudomonadales bacterium]MCP5357586.1 hypothetical protein [Pseudomonadales bacterium]